MKYDEKEKAEEALNFDKVYKQKNSDKAKKTRKEQFNEYEGGRVNKKPQTSYIKNRRAEAR